MKKLGADADTIWAVTGWEYNEADKDWRYEIPDGKINKNVSTIIKGKNLKISDIYDAPDLFKAYPDTKDIKFELTNNESYNGMYNSLTNTLTLNKKFI